MKDERVSMLFKNNTPEIKVSMEHNYNIDYKTKYETKYNAKFKAQQEYLNIDEKNDFGTKWRDKMVDEVYTDERIIVDGLISGVVKDRLRFRKIIGGWIIVLAITSIIFSLLGWCYDDLVAHILRWFALLEIVIAIVFVIYIRRNNRPSNKEIFEIDEIKHASSVLALDEFKNDLYVDNIFSCIEEEIRNYENNNKIGAESIFDIITPIGTVFISVSITLLLEKGVVVNHLSNILFYFGMFLMIVPIIWIGISFILENNDVWKKRHAVRIYKRYKIYKSKYVR